MLNEASAEIIEVGMDGFDAEAELAGAVRQIKERCRTARLLELGGKPLAALSPDERSPNSSDSWPNVAQAIGGLTGGSEAVIH